MKEIYKNLDKIILIFTVLIFLTTILVIVGKTAAVNKNILQRLIFLQPERQSHQAGISTDVSAENMFLVNIKSVINASNKRDLFSPFKNTPEQAQAFSNNTFNDTLIEVLEIGYQPLNVEYRGRITFNNGRVVAQLNIGNDSYLASLGAKIVDYTVEALDENSVGLRNDQGKLMIVRYRKVTYTDELTATVKELNSKTKIKIRKDSDFFGFKVLDITPEYVLVSKMGQHLKLEKGTVQK
ncbi:MAG: hypothetical protein HY810_08165 [Candidatus Omnitrophica bacterium]|nr:hypothetical protein [Candidatus Omnitrophota bacterium]